MILNTQSMRWVFLPVEWVCHFHSLFPLILKIIQSQEILNLWNKEQEFQFIWSQEVCPIKKVKVAQSWPTLHGQRTPLSMEFSTQKIIIIIILEWVAILFSRESSPPRDQTPVSCTTGSFFIIWATREAFQGPSFYVHIPNNLGNARMQFQFLNQCKLNPAHFLFTLLLLLRL